MSILIIDPRSHDLGGGFTVARVLPYRRRRMVGPFIFFDRMGPNLLPAPVPMGQDVRPHPHIGLSTVTYLFEGQMRHRDSLGFDQDILPGDLNWMTAGKGISHSERFDGMREDGGLIDGIQAWVALPEAHEEDEPSFAHYSRDDLPVFSDSGLEGRLIAGNAFGLHSPARIHSPLFYIDISLQSGASITLPEGYPERAVYIANGKIEIEDKLYVSGQMLVFDADAAPRIKASQPSRLMLLGGDPLGERHIWWNFVSSRKERIEQAKEDWEQGRIALPPHDNQEFIPLPDGVA